jgi:hypothetical protein
MRRQATKRTAENNLIVLMEDSLKGTVLPAREDG